MRVRCLWVFIVLFILQSSSSRFSEEFIVNRIIGRGGYGLIMLCTHRLDGMQYAVKEICLDNTEVENKKILREVHMLALMKNRYICRYNSVVLFIYYDFQCWVEDGSKNEDDSYSLNEDEEEEEAIDDTTLTWGRESRQLSYFHFSDTLSDEKDLSSVIPHNETHINEIADSAFDYISESDSSDSSDSYDSYNSYESASTESSTSTSTSLSETTVENRYTNLFDASSVSQTDTKNSESVSTVQKKSSTSSTPKIRKLYIQMEYYKNGTLDDMIQRGDVRIGYQIKEQLYKNKALIWRILSNVGLCILVDCQLLNGLQYVHKQVFEEGMRQRLNIVHRDLKPSNIFFDDEGTAKIGDFGLGYFINRETSVSIDDIEAAESGKENNDGQYTSGIIE